LDGTELTFQTTERNAELIAGGITEKANVTIGTTQLFKALEFSFDGPTPTNINETLSAAPSKAFSFPWLGKTYTGFSRRLGFAPATEKEQATKLLSTPDNDLTNFIR
jgi:hypothetical protein